MPRLGRRSDQVGGVAIPGSESRTITGEIGLLVSPSRVHGRADSLEVERKNHG